MPILRATFFMKDDGGYGWSETIHSTKPDLTACMAAAMRLMPLRIGCLGNTATLDFIRCSDDLIKRDSLIFRVPAHSRANKNPLADDSDIANTCLLLRLDASPLTRRSLYMRGIPDACIVDGGIFKPTPDFRSAQTAWGNEITSNGWACRSRVGVTLPQTITALAQDLTTGRVTVTTAAPHGFVANDPITITGVTGATSINGSHNVVAVIGVDKFAINSTQLLPLWTGGGIARKLGFTLAAITQVTAMRAGHRISGRPFDSPRGRRKAKTKA